MDTGNPLEDKIFRDGGAGEETAEQLHLDSRPGGSGRNR